MIAGWSSPTPAHNANRSGEDSGTHSSDFSRGLLWVRPLLGMPDMNQRETVETPCVQAQLHVEVVNPSHEQNTDADAESLLTVVLCHGFGGSARNFRPQARAFGGRVRFVLYDQRGHARSEKPNSPEAYRFSCLVDDLASVVQRYGTTKVIVGGLSLGSAVALDYTLRQPERVAGMLLSAYPAPPDKLRPWALEFAESIEKYGVSEAGSRFVWGDDSRFDPKARELIRAGFLEHAPWSLASILRLGLAALEDVEQSRDQLRALRVPTRIVVGGDDIGSVTPCRQLSTLIPDAKLSVLEGAGHIVNLARVSEFNEELRKLIDQVSN